MGLLGIVLSLVQKSTWQKRSVGCFASSVFHGHRAGGSGRAGIRFVGRRDGQGRWKAPSILPSLISAATAIFSYCLPTLPTMNIK